MSLDVRAFLRSEGFTVGERGRFSAEMIAKVNEKHPGVLDANGKVVKAPKPPKAPKPAAAPKNKAPRTPKTPKVVVTGEVAAPIVPRPIVRNERTLYAISPVGQTHVRIAYDVCQSCSYSVQTCACKAGPKPPAGAIRVPTYPKV